MTKIERDYRRHIWMVQSRDSQFAVDEKMADGVPELINRDWADCLKAPVWGNRAVWHANHRENKWTVTRVVKVKC